MTMDPTTESIAHFIGLFELRIEELRLRQDYLEFRIKQAQQGVATLEPAGVRIDAPHQLQPYNPELAYTPLLSETLRTDPAGTFFESWADVQILAPGPYFAPNQIEDGFRFSSISGNFTLQPPGSIVSVTLQKITLFDDDLFLDSLGTEFVDPGILHARLHAIVAQAEALVGFALPDLPSDGNWMPFAKDMLDALNAAEAPEDHAEVAIIRGDDANGVFVNGVAVTEAPVWTDFLPLYLRPEEPTNDEVEHTPEDGTATDGQTVQSLTEAPGEGRFESLVAHDFGRDFDGYQAPDVIQPGHQIVAGANTAINEIALYSKWLDASVFVVLGDVARVDAISQVNVLVEHDTIDGVPQTQPSHAMNVAAISTISSADPTAPAPMGGAPAVSFIARIEADLIQVNWVKQFTFATDFDRAEIIFSGSATFLGLGENQMINSAIFNEYGYTFDLIFVSGNMVDATVISQMNILFDSDHVTTGGPAIAAPGSAANVADAAVQTAATSLGAAAPAVLAASSEPKPNDAGRDTPSLPEPDQPINAVPGLSVADNLLLNQVTIERTGADTYVDMKKSFLDAAEEMKAGAKTLAQDVAEDAMFAGREALRVLQIDGDLARINIFEQVNIVGDADQIHLEMARIRDELGVQAQLIAGSNSLVNLVSIFEDGIDSKIMAAQNIYSDAFIHQAGLFDTDAVPTGVTLSNLSNDAVAAFIAQDAVGAAEATEYIMATGNYEAGSTADVMQTALA